MVNLQQLKQQFRKQLEISYPLREADNILSLLAEYYLHWNRTTQLLNQNESLTEIQISFFLDALDQIRKGKPVQYITGIGWFWGMPFKVNSDVLIPRPETEELVQWILNSAGPASRIILTDLCTGSGCIAIALSKELKNAKLRGVDVSKNALEIAKNNENLLLSNSAIEWIQRDILIEDFIQGDEDHVISNPPYIPVSEAVLLDKRVIDFEPHLALFVPDEDALKFYKRIGEQFLKKAKEGAMLWFECHESYAGSVAKLLTDLGLKETIVKTDMQGKQRMVRSLK